MARTDSTNTSQPSSMTTLASAVNSRSNHINRDPNQRNDFVKNEFSAREGTYKISSLIDNLSRTGASACLNDPVKVTLITRIQNRRDSSSIHSSTPNDNSHSRTNSLENQSTEYVNGRRRSSSSPSNVMEVNQQTITKILAFNIGRELIIYEFVEATQPNFGEPIDHRIYKQNHQPTCHDLIQYPDSNVLRVLVGFSKGQIQYINMETKEQKVFNEGSYLDKTKVTCVKWLSTPQTCFAASFSSGYLYIFDEKLNHQRDANVQPTYATLKDDEKNFSVSFLKNKTKQARNPVARWLIGSGSINEFAFSPDQLLLAVVSQDGFLRIFNYEKMELVAHMKSYFGGLLCLCWSPDGKYLATGGEDDFITLFSLDPDDHFPRVLCRGHGHTSWISSISFDPYLSAKTYYSSFIQRSASLASLNKNENHYYEKIKRSIPYSRSDSSCFDSNIPTLFYRIGSVGQDNRLCLWDITEDILKITTSHGTSSDSTTNKNASAHPPLASTTNGYASFLSDSTALISTNPSLSTTTKSSFSSLASRLYFTRNSNKVHKSADDSVHKTSTTLFNGSSKKPRRLSLLSHSISGSKSITSSTSSPNTTNISTSNDSGQGSLSTSTTNSFSSRRTNFDLTKTTFGTNLCPRLDDVQMIEPIATELIAHERLNGIYFGENCLITSSQDGIIAIWEKPVQIQQPQPIDEQLAESLTFN